jgi:hypothetical protein
VGNRETLNLKAVYTKLLIARSISAFAKRWFQCPVFQLIKMFIT